MLKPCKLANSTLLINIFLKFGLKLPKMESLAIDSTIKEEVIHEILRNFKQLQAINKNPQTIGFLKVDFFASKAWEVHSSSSKLSHNQKTTLKQAYSLLSQCNIELKKMEIRKDGFIKGQLSKHLLESGLSTLQKAINALEETA